MSESLKCVIIDDEKKDRENIRILLESYCPNTKIIGEASDRKSILKVLSEVNPDIVFMDIQLGTVSVFDILNELEVIDFKVVFVTAHHKYAIKGYQYNAIDYLLKPVDAKQLIKVMDKTKKLKNKSRSTDNPISDFKKLYATIVDSPKISISDAKGVHIIKVIDILYCASDGNYTTFTMANEKEIIISKNLKLIESKLTIYGFLRIHKSYLMNLNHIDFIVKEQGGSVIMKNGKSLPISRNRRQELYKKMKIM